MALVQGYGFRNQYETKRLCEAVLIVSHKCNWVGYLNTKQKEGFLFLNLSLSYSIFQMLKLLPCMLKRYLSIQGLKATKKLNGKSSAP